MYGFYDKEWRVPYRQSKTRIFLNKTHDGIT